MSNRARPHNPPEAPQKSHSFTHHGVTIDDPYAWLRDPNYPDVESEEILAYLGAENEYFDAYMEPLQPLVDELFEEMKKRRPAEDHSVPYEKNGYLYQWRFAKDAQYRTWHRAPVSDPQAWRMILDEPTLADGQKYFSLGALAVCPQGDKLAYSIDSDGSERYTMHVVDIADASPLTTPITDTIGAPVWNAAGDALLYVVVNEQWQPLQVYRRTLHASGDDPCIFDEPDDTFRVSLGVSQSEEFVFIDSGSHTSNETYTLRRGDFDALPQLMASRRPGIEYHADHGNGEFVIRSNLRHQNFDIYRVPEQDTAHDNWQMWIEGDAAHYLTGHLLLSDHLVIEERIDGLDQVRVVPRNDQQYYVEFPEATYAAGLGINPNFDAAKLRLSYTSLTTPATVYDYDLSERSLATLKVQQIPSGYDPSEFTTERLMAAGRDGVSIPVSLVRHKSTALDGQAPLYLYGYGAYGLGMSPSFSSSRISLLERGFVYAIAHIRGGDELGYHWYTDGKLDKRTNTFNDFVDAARHLISDGVTAPQRIAIAGGSAGGELMGAVVNQAPELWGAVAAHVPFVDVLNTILDASLPLTPPEWEEWGNPIDDANAFANIRSYSPYDQLQGGRYPPMLVTAGLNDPRVTYWEPAKYVAKLRTLKEDNNPLLLKTNMGAGHGGKSGRFEALRELAEEYAFFLSVLG
jgi:oligopeptidase B